MRSSQNALMHGARSGTVTEEAKKLNELLRMLKNVMRDIGQG